MLLGPLTVEPPFRERGIGYALIKRALDEARARGHHLVVLVGDEPYYAKSGFRRIPKGRASMPGPVDPARLLVCERPKAPSRVCPGRSSRTGVQPDLMHDPKSGGTFRIGSCIKAKLAKSCDFDPKQLCFRRSNMRTIRARRQEWMVLKVASGALIIASLLAAGPAGGQSINLATIKCRNFVELSKDTIATLTVWLDGYYTDEEDAAVFEPEKLKANAEKLTAFLRPEPQNERDDRRRKRDGEGGWAKACPGTPCPRGDARGTNRVGTARKRARLLPTLRLSLAHAAPTAWARRASTRLCPP